MMERRTIEYHCPLGKTICNLIIFSLQRNPICGFAFFGVDKVGVDLGGFDAPVGEHLGDRVDVCAECDLECGKGVAEAVECDMLSNPRSLYLGV